jgi:hypothetical protein
MKAALWFFLVLFTTNLRAQSSDCVLNPVTHSFDNPDCKTWQQILSDYPAGENFLDVPQEISQCAGQQCQAGGGITGVWAFSGHAGEGRGPQGMYWQLGVIHYGSDYVEIRGIHLKGPYAGMLTGYKGVVKGDRIEGWATWAWKDQIGKSPWSATIMKPAPKDPEVSTWKFDCEPWPGVPQAIKTPLAATEHFEENHDYAKAVCWAKTAAIRDQDAKGARETSLLYITMRNMEKARYWERIAALRGSPIPSDLKLDEPEFQEQKSWFEEWLDEPAGDWTAEEYYQRCTNVTPEKKQIWGMQCYGHLPSGELRIHRAQ